MTSRFAAVVAVLALVLSLAALTLAWRAAPAGAEPEAAEPEELAHHMAYAQRYAEKLYFAGMNDHAALAAFYVHELEETFEAVAEGGYVEDGQDVGALSEAMLAPALEGVEAAVEAGATGAEAEGARRRFEARYRALVDACNACHQATGHGFVRLVVPAGGPEGRYPGQSFGPPGGE